MFNNKKTILLMYLLLILFVQVFPNLNQSELDELENYFERYEVYSNSKYKSNIVYNSVNPYVNRIRFLNNRESLDIMRIVFKFIDAVINTQDQFYEEMNIYEREKEKIRQELLAEYEREIQKEKKKNIVEKELIHDNNELNSKNKEKIYSTPISDNAEKNIKSKVQNIENASLTTRETNDLKIANKEIEKNETELNTGNLDNKTIVDNKPISKIKNDNSVNIHLAKIRTFFDKNSGIILVVFFSLIFLIGIILGFTNKAVFYKDSKDLYWSFSPVLLTVFVLFSDNQSYLWAAPSILAVIYIFYRTLKFNNKKIFISICITLAKIALSFLAFLFLLGVIEPQGKNGHHKKSNRVSSGIMLAIVGYLMKKLINGDEVESEKEFKREYMAELERDLSSHK